MFLCRRRLCKAISSCKGCENLPGGRTTQRGDGGPKGVPPSPSRVPGHPPAVPLGDLLDGDAHLGAEAAPGVDHPVGAPAQDHPLARLRVLVAVLRGEGGRGDGRVTPPSTPCHPSVSPPNPVSPPGWAAWGWADPRRPPPARRGRIGPARRTCPRRGDGPEPPPKMLGTWTPTPLPCPLSPLPDGTRVLPPWLIPFPPQHTRSTTN